MERCGAVLGLACSKYALKRSERNAMTCPPFSAPLPLYPPPSPACPPRGAPQVFTRNRDADQGLESETHPWLDMNTGVYWVRQGRGGGDMFDAWLRWQAQEVGHDQDGLQVGGRARWAASPTAAVAEPGGEPPGGAAAQRLDAF